MMTTQQLTMIWDHLRQMNGITMRLVDLIPADRNQKDTREITDAFAKDEATSLRNHGVIKRASRPRGRADSTLRCGWRPTRSRASSPITRSAYRTAC